MLHDRKTAVKLTMFYTGDFNSGIRNQDHEDSNWSTCVAIFMIQEAVVNWQSLVQQIFPMDYTPVIIWRVLIKYHWCKMVLVIKKRIMVILCFFEDVIKDNANKAVNDIAPMNFTEMELMLVNRIQKAGVPATIPLLVDAETPEEKPQNTAGPSNFRGRGGRGGRGGSRGGRGRGGAPVAAEADLAVDVEEAVP